MSLQTRLTDLVAAIGADIKDLKSKATLLSSAQIDSWHTVGAAGEPAFGAKWQSFGDPYVPQFKKLPDGTVRIRGMVSPVAGGGAFTTVFTLPVGYRPSSPVIRPSMASSGAAEILIDLRIGTDGAVQFGVATTSYHTIDISFAVDQPTLLPVVQSSVTQEGWHYVGSAGEPAFLNSWGNMAGAESARFRKDPAGRVYFEGDVTGGASSTTVFTLPVGYRPDRLLYFPILLDGGAAGGYVLIAADGSVSVTRGAQINGFVKADFWTGQTTFPSSKSVIPIVSALPAGTDGDEIYLQTTAMATDGIMWHLRYRGKNPDGSPNTSAYKWEYVGGAALRADGASSSAGVPYTNLQATGQPSIVIPFAGDYVVEFAAAILYNQANVTNQIEFSAYKTGDVDLWSGQHAAYIGQVNGHGAPTGKMEARANGLVAGNSVYTRYKSISNQPHQCYQPQIALRPIRIG